MEVDEPWKLIRQLYPDVSRQSPVSSYTEFCMSGAAGVGGGGGAAAVPPGGGGPALQSAQDTPPAVLLLHLSRSGVQQTQQRGHRHQPGPQCEDFQCPVRHGHDLCRVS